MIRWFPDITNMGNITVKYFQGDAKLTGAPKDAGTYIVKIDIAESQNYNAATDLSDLASWTFTINPASEAPGYTTQTTIPVSWSCKKVGDITNIQPNHEGDKDNKGKTYKISDMDKQVIAVRPYI